jgi:hypothetical protein
MCYMWFRLQSCHLPDIFGKLLYGLVKKAQLFPFGLCRVIAAISYTLSHVWYCYCRDFRWKKWFLLLLKRVVLALFIYREAGTNMEINQDLKIVNPNQIFLINLFPISYHADRWWKNCQLLFLKVLWTFSYLAKP